MDPVPLADVFTKRAVRCSNVVLVCVHISCSQCSKGNCHNDCWKVRVCVRIRRSLRFRSSWFWSSYVHCQEHHPRSDRYALRAGCMMVPTGVFRPTAEPCMVKICLCWNDGVVRHSWPAYKHVWEHKMGRHHLSNKRSSHERSPKVLNVDVFLTSSGPRPITGRLRATVS